MQSERVKAKKIVIAESTGIVNFAVEKRGSVAQLDRATAF